MAGELNALRDGYPVALAFTLQNPAAAATTNMVTVALGPGFVVPAGYVFHPMALLACSNAVITAGTGTFNVTAAAVAIANGPTAVVQAGAQQNTGLARFGASPQPAGTLIGVNLVTNAGYLPVTADHDVMLSGVLALA